ncbi:MAG: hypothetical protein IPN39_05765 [Chitinophagaceae bacterium]|jgi:uncharacterized membrane protein|nr:hypothetical protein [Chitinophagaceae bacterium]MBK9380815.1 hypothetical protein [Chitinophagaceae bacterium]MBL0307807.1 hypothetical protein [Chitinophagaceae bacterium]HQV60638.1 hypothetical protein [Chitinophagaceae bacterium]HQV84445.1 hypothetical protein [Chitinophagaceae bacterium]
MEYFISVTIILICIGVIILALKIYKENRELEKQQKKYRDDEDFPFRR